MKLYIKPASCSLAPHIILKELGVPFETDVVDFKSGLTASGKTFTDVNPKNVVPVLELEDGELITENAAILQYLADLKPEALLAGASAALGRARLQEYLSYIGADLHKSFGPLFSETSSDEMKADAKAKVRSRFDYLNSLFADGRTYLMEQYSVADAYLFVMCNWANFVDIPLGNWPHLSAFMERAQARAATQDAMRAEGLVK